MKNENVFNTGISRTTRVVVLSVFGLASIFMFSLAFTAEAASLYRQLQLGMSGNDVSDLQVFLAKDPSIYPQGLVTGYFGSLTRAAVSNFQARNGIAVVGRVGPITMAAINAQMNSGSTVGVDRFAPVMSSVVISPSSNSSTINWNTSENASAIVYYSTSPISMLEASGNSAVTIGGSSLLVSADLRTSHSANLTSLSSNTLYYYVVYVRDASGNETVTWPATFRTN
jgi:Putative peptidoglycan binding domain/Purple acid Phosphatase, N-terminal domain